MIPSHLCAHGLYHKKADCPLPNAEEIQLCKQWITENCEALKNIKEYSSYAYKHRVEESVGRYISNGAFIQAAIELGFNYKDTFGSMNTHFNFRIKPVNKRVIVYNAHRS